MDHTTGASRPPSATTRSRLSSLRGLRSLRSDARTARASRLGLERELASYTSAADLTDLEAILARHTEEDTREIRSILAARIAP